MPTTSNFGWTTPADTDYVKDGALAIRTLGNGIDTSLIDLKGGTTGQILSKASNTDLDYTWINNDQGDITEVQAGTGISVASGTGPVPVVTNTVATTFDAKGDLVVGTGADTFAKRTVGADETRLVADSVETTGVKWVADTTNYAIAAKGDLLVGTAADTLTALTVGGTNGQVLQVDSSTATGLKWATPAAGGKVLQVVSAETSTDTVIASTTYTDTGLSASITPSSTNSKILVLISQFATTTRSANDQGGYSRLMRGATVIYNDNGMEFTIGGATSMTFGFPLAYAYLDSPATTSSTTYKTQGKVGTTNNSGQITFNSTSLGSIVLLEIGA